MTALIDIVIPVHCQRDRLAGLLPALLVDGGFRVIVADDASADRPETAHPPHDRLRFVRLESRGGPSAARRRGWDAGDAEFVLALDSDARLEPAAIRLLADRLRSAPRLAALGAVLRQPDGRLHHAGIGIDPDGMTRLLPAPENSGPVAVDAVGSAAALYRRSAVDAVGGFDPRLWYYEDVDLSWRLRRAGWQVAVDPGTLAVHAWGGTMGRQRSLARFDRQEYARRRMLVKNLTAAELRRRLPRLLAREAWLLGWSLGRGLTDLAATRGGSLLYPAAWLASGLRAAGELAAGDLRFAGPVPR